MKIGAVLFLDLLGFKGIWQSRTESEIVSLLTNVQSLVDKTFVEPNATWPKCERPAATVLSDTIVVTIECAKPHALLLIGHIAIALINHFALKDIFLRGAVSFGPYYQEGPVFLGPAIDDVATWYERADWIGVIATPRTNYILDGFTHTHIGVENFAISQFIKYAVPIKNGSNLEMNVFNWPIIYQEMRGPKQKTVEKFFRSIFANQSNFDERVMMKYENTLAFIRHSVSSYDPNTPHPPKTA